MANYLINHSMKKWSGDIFKSEITNSVNQWVFKKKNSTIHKYSFCLESE